METARVLLAIAGKFPGDYTDGRFSAPEGDLTANLGRMPLLEEDGQSVGQSLAIFYYVASQNGLMGNNAWDAAQILSIHEHVKELNAAFRTVVPWGAEPTVEALDKWFDGGANDVTGVADRAGQSTRYLTWFMGRIEATLGNQGFAVGDKLSLADVLLFQLFGEFLKAEEAGDLPAFRRFPFTDKERTDAKLAAHPKIKASVDAVANNANVQKWLAMRGVQGF